MPKTSRGKGNGEGVSPPQQTRRSGGAAYAPPVGSGAAENEFWRILELEKTHLIDTNLSFLTFLQHTLSQKIPDPCDMFK